jgi:PKD repeat protein
VVLTVDDGNGGTGTASQVITVNTPGNNPPQALFTANPISGEAPLLVNFDASASSDPDGDSFTYDWDFGDGNSDTGLTVSNTSNTYSAGGTYTVVLTVDDGNGGTDTASQVITVTVNQSPVADAGADQNVIDTNGDGSESVTLDGSASYDPDGGAEGGSPLASGPSPSVIFAVGSHTVTLTVTDDEDATATDTVTIVVTAPANSPPTASFSYDCDGYDCSFDGIVSYDWDFDDSTSGSGATPSHTYGAAGSYNVTLTVTDDDGASDSTSLTVSPTEPSSDPHLWTTRIQASTDQWQQVTVGNGYDYGDNMVVVCTPNYSISGLGPRYQL